MKPNGLKTSMRWALAAMLAAALACLLPVAGSAKDEPAPRTDKRPRGDRAAEEAAVKAAARAQADKQTAADFEAKIGEQPTTEEDDSPEAQRQRRLAARDRELGATFPGKDPAFLVLPRPAARAETAKQLLSLKFDVSRDAPDGSGKEVFETDVPLMTRNALEYLAKTQDADGGWSDTQFPSNTGATALACLAFMAEGSRPRIGQYGRSLDRGLEFILKNVQSSSGVIAGKGSNPYGPAYEHAFSTLALLYAYGDNPRQPQIRDIIAKAIQALANAQRLDGGWRYEFTREGHSDMSVTANVLWVLRTAKKCGYTVSVKRMEGDKEVDSIAAGVKYVTQCAMPDGTFRYRTWGIHAAPSLGGTGVIALCNNGQIDHPLIMPAVRRIAYDYERYTVEDLKERRYFIFGAFYASLAMYMCGDHFTYVWPPGSPDKRQGGFDPWFRKAARVLADIQLKGGEFPDEFGNTIYSTAMAAILLQAPLGYLPIYER